MNAVWKKDNVVYKGPQAVTFIRSPDGRMSYMTSELLLQNITDEDAGRYQCIVSNDFGSTYSSRAKITVHGNLFAASDSSGSVTYQFRFSFFGSFPDLHQDAVRRVGQVGQHGPTRVPR